MPTTPPETTKPIFMKGLTTTEMLFALKALTDHKTKEQKQAADQTEAAKNQTRADQKQAKAERDEAKAAQALADIEQDLARLAEQDQATRAAAAPARNTATTPSTAAATSPTTTIAIAAAPKPQSLCHHIMPSGRRCRSVRCNQTHYCYFHSGELVRRHDRIDGMHANYRLSTLPVIEDRASIQIVLNEIIRSYISDAIDSRKAGILLYGMNIALANLRNDVAPVIAEEDAVPAYNNIPEHDPIARLDDEESATYQAEQKLRMDKLDYDPFAHSTQYSNLSDLSAAQLPLFTEFFVPPAQSVPIANAPSPGPQ